MATNILTNENTDLLSIGSPSAVLTNENTDLLSIGQPSVRLTNENTDLLSIGQPSVRITNLNIEILGIKNKPVAPPSFSSLTLKDNQTRTFCLQVYRNGNWVDVPIRTANGRIDKGKAGQLTVVIDDKENDQYRSHLYEGEKIRAYRGVIGIQSVRCWTGFVDAPTVTDEGQISRSVSITDNLQELNTAIFLDGFIFDNQDPMYVCASVIQYAIDTDQYIPSDDSGNPLTGATSGFGLPNGNPLCYFPELYNLDGSLFTLASGELGSYTSGPFAYASMSVPIASGSQTYLTYTLPNQYLIASMTQFIGFSTSASNAIPPASGSAVIDYYNGILYFNLADQGKTLFFSSTFFQSPVWSFAPGQQIFDVISEIMDKSGCRWGVDAYGKFWSKFIDTTVAPKRIFNRASYLNLSIQINRDRRNVIVIEGWDGVLSQLIVAMAVNYTDITSAPPIGLGKRSYMIVQDQSWKDQPTVNQAAYFAAQQIGKRGKIKSVKIVDDPTINVEDVVGFIPPFSELTTGDLFYVDSIEWEYSIAESGEVTANETISGGSIPGQGLVYVNPVNTNSSIKGYNFSNIQPIRNCSLTPTGGTYFSTFSIANGLIIHFDESYQSYGILIGQLLKINVFGSDGSSQTFSPGSAYMAGGTYSFSIPMGGFAPNVFYIIQIVYIDPWGNSGYYRDFITSLP